MIKPSDTFTIYLDIDTPEAQRLPDERRPAAIYRYGTAAELEEHEERLAACNKLLGLAYLKALSAAASDNLISVRNLVKPDGTPTERISEAMSIQALKWLASRITIESELTGPDRKNSESQSPLPAAAAVGSATQAVAATLPVA